MTTFDPLMATTELAAAIREGSVTPSAAVDGYLAEIERQDEEINAYITVTDELARDGAAAAAEALETGEAVGPLHGVPVALKDLSDLKEGVPHSFGSKLIGESGYVAPRTSAAVARLEKAGAVILGKTNTPEFGHKGVTDNLLVGPTASPIDPANNAGGSSGGSAAAVAAGMASFALGSDAGGSIRLPAAACGVYGHKPSYGLVPRDSRPNAFGGETHHVTAGPITRTVEDAALALEVLSGYHPRDPASVPVEIDYTAAIGAGVSDLRVGYSPDLGVFSVEDEVAATVSETVDALADAGATVERVTVDHGLSLAAFKEAVTTTFSTDFVGVAEVVRREVGLDLRAFPDDVSETLLRLLEIGEEQTVRDVAASGLVRTQFFDAMQDTLEEIDLLITPTTGISKLPLETDLGLEWELALTWPFNWTGHPAASVPAGRTENGGLAAAQIIGRQYEDDTVLAASDTIERERPWAHLYK